MKHLWSLILVLACCGCSVTATRPVQEMAIADAALKAAREVNADAIENSRIPEIYRAAAESLFRAKREYKLKNFDASRKYALKATALAEKAEFEAIKAGGATPEAMAARANALGEGAQPDPNVGGGASLTPENEEQWVPDSKPENPQVPPPAPLAPPTPAPTSVPRDEDGELYTDMQDREQKKKDEPAPPEGQQNPQKKKKDKEKEE